MKPKHVTCCIVGRWRKYKEQIIAKVQGKGEAVFSRPNNPLNNVLIVLVVVQVSYPTFNQAEAVGKNSPSTWQTVPSPGSDASSKYRATADVVQLEVADIDMCLEYMLKMR